MKITGKLLVETLKNWSESSNGIMDSQKKYNEAALEWSKSRLENWLKKEFDNATA